jgi:hypothetical protein
MKQTWKWVEIWEKPGECGKKSIENLNNESCRWGAVGTNKNAKLEVERRYLTDT